LVIINLRLESASFQYRAPGNDTTSDHR